MSAMHSINQGCTDPKLDIVFLHGLGGHWRTTWARNAKDDTTFWPAWIAEEIPSTNVYSIEYEAEPVAMLGSAMPLTDRANNILTLLETGDFGERPIIFICHSLGGLVVKKMLQNGYTFNNPDWLKIVRQVRGVVFLGTPNTGSDAATSSYLKALARIFKTNVNVTELEKNAPALRELNTWYKENSVRNKVDNFVFFENKPTYNVMVVDQASADPGITGVIPRGVDADHISISKPTDREHLVHKRSTRFINDVLKKKSASTHP